MEGREGGRAGGRAGRWASGRIEQAVSERTGRQAVGRSGGGGGWLDGGTDVRMYGRTDVWMYRRTYVWTDGRTDGRTDGIHYIPYKNTIGITISLLAGNLTSPSQREPRASGDEHSGSRCKTCEELQPETPPTSIHIISIQPGDTRGV